MNIFFKKGLRTMFSAWVALTAMMSATDVWAEDSNTAPVIETSSSSIAIASGTKVLLPVSIYDLEGDDISTSLAGSADFTVEDGKIYYTGGVISSPDADKEYSLTVTSTDGNLSTEKVLSVTVKANHAPTIVGTNVSLNVLISGSGTYYVPTIIEDEDGDPITLSLSGKNESDFKIENTNFKFILTLTNLIATSKTFSVDVTATDDKGASTTETINLTVNRKGNNQVTLTVTSNEGVEYGTALKDAYTCTAKNDDGDIEGTWTIKDADGRTLKGTDILSAGDHELSFTFIPTDLKNKPEKADATISIAKRAITFSSSSDTKVYDGTALTNKTVSADVAFVGSDGFYYTGFASQTNAGSTDNTFTVNAIVGTNLDNYSITSNTGTLTVTAKTITPEVILQPTTYEYDGTAKTPSVTVKDGDDVLSSSEYEVSYLSNTDASDNAKVTVNTVGNYVFDAISKQFSITPKTVGLTWSETTSYTYDGEEHSVSATVTGAITGESVSVKTYKNNTATKAGSYTAEVTALDNDNYKLPTSGTTQKWTITPKTVGLEWSETTSYTYDGEEHSVSATVTGAIIGDAVAVKTYKNNAATKAGSYTAEVTALDNDNYKLPTSGTTQNWTITAKDVAVTVSVDKTPLTYNGTAQKPAVTVNVGDDELSSDEYEVSYLYNTDASDTAKVIVKATGNYAFATVTQNFSIAPKTVGLTWSETASYTYDGKEHSVSATVTGIVTGDAVAVKTYKDNKATKAGSYTAEVTALDNDNYKLPTTGTTQTWTITAKDVAVTVSVDKTPLTYNGKAQKPAVTVNVGEDVLSADEYEVSYLYNTNASDTAKVIVKATGNYAFATTTQKFSIAPKTVGLTWSGTTSFIYDGEKHSVSATLSGIITGESVSIKTYKNITATNAGSYTAEVTALTNANYQLPTTGTTQTWTITPKTVGLEWSETTSYTYDGEEHSVSATVTDVVTGESVAVKTYENNSATKAGSYTAEVTALDNANYQLPTSGTTQEWTITAKEVTVTVTVDKTALTYNGEAQTPAVTVNVGEVALSSDEYEVSYLYNTDASDTAKVTVKATGNYAFATTSQKFSIAPKTVGLTWSETTSYTYDGKEHSISATVTGAVTGDVVAVKTYNNNKATKAGSYTAEATALDNANYQLPTTGISKEWEITAKEVSVTVAVDKTPLTYNGEAQTPAVTVNVGEDELSSDEYEVSYLYNTDASDTAKVTVKATGNYAFATTTQKFSIAPKTVGLTWSETTSYTYDGEEHSVSATVTGAITGDAVAVKTYENNTATKAGSYTAEVTALDNANYQLPTTGTTQNWTITAKEVTVTVAVDKTALTYNGEAQTPAVTVNVGEDVLSSDDYEVSYLYNTNASDTAKVTVKATGNYAFATTSQKFSIAQKTVTLSWNADSYDYDGEEHSVSATVLNAEDKDVVAVNRYAATTATAAGSYTAIALTLNNSNYKLDEENSTHAWTIKKKAVSVDVVVVGSYTYTGKAQTPTIKVMMGETVLPEDQYSVSCTNNKNAGTATVTVDTAKADGNYKFDAVSADFEIAKIAVELDWTDDEFIYNGETQTTTALITNAVTGEKVTVTKYTDNSAVNVGEYEAKVMAISNTANYMVAATDSTLDWKIVAQTGTTSATLAQTEYVYSGSEIKPAVTVKMGNNVIPAENYKVTYADNKNVGTATVSIEANKGANYSFSTIEKTFTITKRVAGIEWSDDEFTYDGELHTVTASLTNVAEGDELTILGYENNSATKVGQYTAKVTGISVNDNYTVAEEDYTHEWAISVSSGEMKIKLDKTSLTYNGSEQTPSVVVKLDNTVIPESEYTVAYKDNKNVGTATVTVTDNKDGNYQVSDLTATFTITPIQVELGWSDDEFTYDGTEHTVTATVNNAVKDDEFVITYDKNKATNVGNYTAKITDLGNNNYSLASDDSTHVWAVSAASGAMTVTLENTSLTYNGKAQTPAVVVKMGTLVIPAEEYSVTYKDNIYVGKASVAVTDKENGNYEVENLSATFAITPLNVELEWSAEDFDYNGKKQGVEATVLNAAGEDVVNVTAYENDSAIVAGSYTAKALSLSNSNYSIGADDSTHVWTISKVSGSSISIVSDGAVLTYNGKAQQPNFTVKYGDEVLGAEQYKIEFSNNINAGTATAVVSPAEGGNYSFETAIRSFKIQPVQITLESGSNTWQYDGKEHSEPKVVKTEGQYVGTDTFTCEVTASIVKAGTVENTFTYTFSGESKASNYKVVSVNGNLTVTPVVLATQEQLENDSIVDPVSGKKISSANALTYTYTVGRDTFTYDGTAHTPEVKVYLSNGTEMDTAEYAVSYNNNVDAGQASLTISNKAGNYSIATFAHNFVIVPAAVTVKSASHTWTYNGQAHSDTLVSVTEGAFVEGQGLDYEVLGRITNVGHVDNDFTYTAKEGTKLSNYDVKVVKGELTVTSAVLAPVSMKGAVITDPSTGDTVKNAQFYKTVLDTARFTYNGKAQQPVVSIYLDDEKLSADEYEVTFSNNTNAGKALVSVKNKSGNYTLLASTDTFTIVPVVLTLESGSKTWTFDGKAHSLHEVNVTKGAFVGDEGFDYVMDDSIVKVGTVMNQFTYTAKEGTDVKNYAVTSIYGKLTVTSKVLVPMADAADSLLIDPATGDTIDASLALIYTVIVKNTDSLVYNGKAHEPTVEIYVSGKKLTANDYEVVYTDNVNAGMGKMTIKSKEGGNYSIIASTDSFKIAPVAITLTSASKTWIYDGSAHKADSVSVTKGKFIDGEGFDYKVTGSITKVGTADNTFTYTAKEGSKTSNYKVTSVNGQLKVTSAVLVPSSLAGKSSVVDPVSGDTVNTQSAQTYTVKLKSADSLVYNGKAQTPSVEIYVGDKQIDAAEYTVKYSNNTNAGKASVTISNKAGQYQLVSCTDSFTIAPVALTLESASKTWVYDGTAHKADSVSVKKGAFVKGEGFDYKVTGSITEIGTADNAFTYTAKSGTNASNYKVTTVKGQLKVINAVLIPTSMADASKVVDPESGDTIAASLAKTYTVKLKNADSLVYDGKAKEPSVEIYMGDKQIDAAEYEIKYSNNTKAGDATITVKNKKGGNYGIVESSVKFVINPYTLKATMADSLFTYDGKRKQVKITLEGILKGDSVKATLSGDTATNAGDYVAKITKLSNSNYTVKNTAFNWTIEKADYVMPTLTPVAETVAGAKDGRIKGLVKGMEYKKDSASKFTTVTDVDMKFAAGTYEVRMPETANYNESETVKVVIESGEVPFVIDTLLVNSFGYCPETEDSIRYEVSGDNEPAEYRIFFDEDAKDAGFESVLTYTSIKESGVLPISVPDCEAGTYKAQIQFRTNAVESKMFDVEIKVNLSAGYMRKMWSDVVSAINVENIFEEYQWYHNDKKLVGETMPYYCEKNGLTGNYYMEVKTTDDRHLRTCKIFFDEPEVEISLNAYPNPTTDNATIELSYDNGEEHTLKVYNTAGEAEFSDTFTGKKTNVDFSDLSAGTYVVSVDGVEVKVIKK